MKVSVKEVKEIYKTPQLTQLENTSPELYNALVKEGDILWAFSTSGSSENIIAAAKLAKEKKAWIIAFTGRANSVLEKIADLCFCADSKSTARSQEIHQLVYHIICDIVECNFSDDREGY